MGKHIQKYLLFLFVTLLLHILRVVTKNQTNTTKKGNNLSSQKSIEVSYLSDRRLRFCSLSIYLFFPCEGVFSSSWEGEADITVQPLQWSEIF